MNNFLHTKISDCIVCVRSSVREAISRAGRGIADVMDSAGESALSKAGVKAFALALSSDGMSKVDVPALGAAENFDDGIQRKMFRDPNVIPLEGDPDIFSDDHPLIHAIKFTAQQDLPHMEIEVRRVPLQNASAYQWSLTNSSVVSGRGIRVVRTQVTYDSGVSLILGSDRFVDMHYLNALCETPEEWAGITLHHLQTGIGKGWATESEQAWLAQVTDVLDTIASGAFADLDDDDDLDGDDLEDSVSLFEETERAMRNMMETLTEEQYTTINRIVIRSVARSQKRWADRGRKGASDKMYKFVKETKPTSITPELAERFIKAILNDGSPTETQSEVFYNLGDFKSALEARIKTVRMFDYESVAAEWVRSAPNTLSKSKSGRSAPH